MMLPKETLRRIPYWIAAALVGVVAVGYAKLINLVQGLYFDAFHAQPLIVSFATPVIFLAAAYAVVRAAPAASGSGIPQVLEAIEQAHGNPDSIWSSPLVSMRTALVKVVSSVFGILGGASIGREGPTVQIASSLFALLGRWTRRLGIKVDFSSYLIGGGAAGVAAAFNTPLAGVTFALEELAEGAFGPFKRMAMISVVIAGVTAQALVGNYLYFGHPSVPEPSRTILACAFVIGIGGGIAGGVFAWLIAHPLKWLAATKWWRRALICGVLCSLITFLTSGDTAGSGYEITRKFMDEAGELPALFPVWKLATTVLSYYSGMAGGIFSPSLAIGAGVGSAIAKLAHVAEIKSCALLGMVAFFSGAIQAPLTGVIIVMEMADEHGLIIPFLVAAFLAQRVGQSFLAEPLYKHLALKRAKG